MSHKHCVFCGDELPSPRPTIWSSVCTSEANTTNPDTVGNRHHAFLTGRTDSNYKPWESGAAQEVSPHNPIERKLLTICPECGSKERDPRRALSTDSKRLYLCDNSWHVEEVSPPSPEPCEHERLDADGTCKCGWSVVTRSWEAPYSPERELPRAEDSRKAQRKYVEGDTRELKAALEHMTKAAVQWNGDCYRCGYCFAQASIPPKIVHDEDCEVPKAEKLLG
jgi:hypothetical protein